MKIPDYAADIPERTIRGIRDHVRRLERRRRLREAEAVEDYWRRAFRIGTSEALYQLSERLKDESSGAARLTSEEVSR